ncbi:RHS repeat-associated core domain-containing protein [Desulfuromonas acetoxidans]|uniref:RHS repeat-associated core domain-containing protein n=1 Tax=Desulfuromonas acetoxidans TaxID=891 RepID=UPI00293125DF|nr:RHS repeat-associated core domain-containing protein [Desulfuromonas acetoxidans]
MYQSAENQTSFYDTSFICEDLIPRDSFYRKFREIVWPLIDDEMFFSMYCLDNGRPAISPALLAMATILQFHKNLSDREMERACMFDIEVKYAWDYQVDDEGNSQIADIYKVWKQSESGGSTIATPYQVHTDQIGAPILLTDTTGTAVWSAQYAPFGQATINNDVDGDGTEVVCNLRFPGQYFDAESGLHYNWHRYYEPRSGRYITLDPIGLAGGINLYAYVGNNPVGLADPKGLDPVDDVGWETFYKTVKAVKSAVKKASEGVCNPCASVVSVNKGICQCYMSHKGDFEEQLHCFCMFSSDPNCEDKIRERVRKELGGVGL